MSVGFSLLGVFKIETRPEMPEKLSMQKRRVAVNKKGKSHNDFPFTRNPEREIDHLLSVDEPCKPYLFLEGYCLPFLLYQDIASRVVENMV